MWIFSLTSRFSSKSPRGLPAQAGFTLIELVVVSAIILLITGFILTRQSRFDSASLLRSLTYSVALSVRQAQVFGTSVRESTPGSGVFSSNYGVNWVAATVDSYTLFADTNPSPSGDGLYTPGQDSVVKTYTLGQRFIITRLCAKPTGGGALVCNPTITSLNVYFRRPYPDALFKSSVGGASYSAAYIELGTTGNTDTRAVKVSSTGQISVCAPNLSDLETC